MQDLPDVPHPTMEQLSMDGPEAKPPPPTLQLGTDTEGSSFLGPNDPQPAKEEAPPPPLSIEDAVIDVCDDIAKWRELSSRIPVATLEAMETDFGVGSIGAIQTTIRSEKELDDFMHAVLSQPSGPLLPQTGTEGMEIGLQADMFRISRWGSAMTRLWEDCHHDVNVCRQTSRSAASVNPMTMGQALGQAIDVNLSTRGEEFPVPRINNDTRREMLIEYQRTWPGLLLRDITIPGPRCMDQVYNDRKAGNEFKYYSWKAITSVNVEQELEQKKQEMDLERQELDQKKQDLDQEKQELDQEKQEMDKKKQELDQEKQEMDKKKHEMEQYFLQKLSQIKQMSAMSNN